MILSLSLFSGMYNISYNEFATTEELSEELLRNHKPQAPTPRYSYLIGFGWSPGLLVFLKSSQVILMCQPRLRSAFVAQLEAQFWWVNE